MRFGKLALATLLVVASASVQAQTTYVATDTAAGPGNPTPNSTAKAIQFDTAASMLGSENFISFESAPLGNFTTLVAAPGVTLTGVNSSIRNTPSFPTNPALDGFNTTAGGSQYVEQLGGSLVFTFNRPIVAFAALFTGVQPVFFTDTITFNDGTSQSITIPALDATNGGVSFAGFTDAGKTITSVTITPGTSQGGDFIGVDDARFVYAVPEPGSLALLAGMGAVGAGFLRRRKQANKAA